MFRSIDYSYYFILQYFVARLMKTALDETPNIYCALRYNTSIPREFFSKLRFDSAITNHGAPKRKEYSTPRLTSD